MPPSHATVRAALAPLADAELDHWTRAADSYVLFEDEGGLPGCTTWVLAPVGASTPVGVRLVEADGDLVLTSQRAEAIGVLLERHPPPDEAMAQVFFRLWAEPTRAVEAVAGTARMSRDGDTTLLTLDLEDRWRGRLRWSARTSPRGTTVATEPLPGGPA